MAADNRVCTVCETADCDVMPTAAEPVTDLRWKISQATATFFLI